MYRSWSSDNSSSGGQSRRASTADQSVDDEGIVIRQLLDETAPGSQMQEISHPTRGPGLNVRIWAIIKPEYRTLSTSQFPWEAILFADDQRGDISGVPPINRLPARLLSEIFLNCAEWYAGRMHELLFSAKSVPLVLSAVCGLWRDVALHVPELWRSMFLRPFQGRGHHRMANLFLQRARGRFLYVGYGECSDAGSAVAERCSWAIDFIRQNLRQIIYLHLDDITDRTVSRLAGLSSVCAPALASLHVKMRPGQCSQESMRILASLYTGSSRLVTLDWHASVFPQNVHWPQITRIELKHCPVDSMTVLHIIQSAVLLRDLDIDITLAPRLPNCLSVLYPAVRNTSLKKLAITGDGWAQDELFRPLDLPHLQELELKPYDENAPSALWPFRDISVFLNFLRRLQDGLKWFRLCEGGRVFDEAALLRVIGMPQMSTLIGLFVDSIAGRVGDTFFKRLTCALGSRPLLPALEQLRIYRCSTTDGVIARMLWSRCNHPYPLRMVVFGVGLKESHAHVDDLDALYHLKRAGWFVKWYEVRPNADY